MATDLFELRLDARRNGSATMQSSLHRQLRDAISSGRLAAGARLPSTRMLADELGVSRNTTSAVYELLLSEGYAVAHRGSGTFVAELPRRRASAGADESLVSKLAPQWRDTELPQPWPNPLRYDFRPGVTDQRLFPFDIWRRHVARALRELARAPGATAEAQGRGDLRAAIAVHVAATRAVSCTPEQVFVTTGAQQAFDLLARVLVQPRRTRVAFENPGYALLRSPFEAAGAHLCDIPVDVEGLRVDLLPTATHVICVSPSHQFPYGVTMSAARRAELLEFAQRRDSLVIEDDYDGEFRLTGRPLDALQTLDRDGRVFYVGTFSKSFYPSVRAGYIIAPPWARAALVAAKIAHNWNAPVATQIALASFIRDGHLARHVRRMRRVYAERHAALHVALARHLSGVVQPWPALAGLHVCGAVSARVDANEWARAARAAHIRIESLSKYFHGRKAPNGLIFGLGLIDGIELDSAIRALAALAPRR